MPFVCICGMRYEMVCFGPGICNGLSVLMDLCGGGERMVDLGWKVELIIILGFRTVIYLHLQPGIRRPSSLTGLNGGKNIH